MAVVDVRGIFSAPSGPVLAATSLAAEGLASDAVSITPANVRQMIFGGLVQATNILTTNSNVQAVLGLSQNYLDFNVTGSMTSTSLDYYNKLVLEVAVTNGDGADALTVPNAWNLFNRIELQSNSNILKTFQNPQQMEDWYTTVVPRFEFQSWYDQLGYASGTAFGTVVTTIAAGATKVFRIPLHWLFPELVAGIPNAIFGSVVTLRFWFNAGASYYASNSASTTVSCSQCRLLTMGQTLGAPGRQALVEMTARKTVAVPMHCPQFRQLQVGAVADGSFSGGIQTIIPAAVSEISMWIYSNGAPATPQTRAVTARFGAVNFIDGAGSTINVGSTTNGELMAWQSTLYGIYNVLVPQSTETTGVYFDQGPRFTFCQRIVPTKLNKVRHGNYSLAGTESIAFQPPTGTSYTNAVVFAFFWNIGVLWVNPDGSVAATIQQR